MLTRKSFLLKFICALLFLAGLALINLPLTNRLSVDEIAALPATSTKPEDALKNFGDMPLSFEPNLGQAAAEVKYLARTPYYSLFFTEREAVFRFRKTENNKIKRDVMRMRFDNAEGSPRVKAEAELEGRSSHFIGSDPEKWQRGLKNYGRLVYEGIYKDIDAVFYGEQRSLEYDFVVGPGADPKVISVFFDGASETTIEKDGSLALKIGTETVKFGAPVSFQEIGGEQRPVESKYVRGLKEGSIGFEVGDYDKSQTLVIDPKLIFSTYVGGNVESPDIIGGTGDSINGITTDAAGNVYITGNTDSTDFPVTAGAFQPELELRGFDDCIVGILPCGDAFVAKINSTGTGILYATYLGGHNADAGFGIAVDAQGRAYVAGGTDPFNAASFCINPYLFPVKREYQGKPCYGARGEADAFFTVLDPAGSELVYSTYYGGGDDEHATAIGIDNSGRAYIAGKTNSNNLANKNGFQEDRANSGTANDAFIAKFDPDESGNSSLLYASYLGGSGDDIALGIDVDNVGNAYVVGSTGSNNLTTKAPGAAPLRATFGGGTHDGFVSKIDATNASGPNSLVYLSYFGGTGIDVANAVTVEPATQRAHVTGRTNNATGFPLLNAFDGSATGSGEAFVAKLNANGTTLFYSSFLGGSGFDEGRAIALDAANNVYVAGKTLSTNFPAVNAFQGANAGGGGDAFVTKISAVTAATQPRILYSSYHGGGGGTGGDGRDDANTVALDSRGNVYFGGVTTSFTFPTTAGTIKRTAPGIEAGNSDGFVAKVDSTFNEGVGVFRGTNQFIISDSTAVPAQNANLTVTTIGNQPVAADWNRDGIDELGVFNSNTGQFIIRTRIRICSICPPFISNVTVNFGQPGDLPVTGDWNGDGFDTVGVFRPGAGQFILNNDQLSVLDSSSIALQPQITINFGIAEDQPMAGDWDSDGVDSVGVFRPSSTEFFLTNDNVLKANVDIGGTFGLAEDLPVAGDWDGDGRDSIGVWRPSIATFFLTNDNASVAFGFAFGQTGDKPVALDRDGVPNQ